MKPWFNEPKPERGSISEALDSWNEAQDRENVRISEQMKANKETVSSQCSICSTAGCMSGQCVRPEDGRACPYYKPKGEV